MNQRIYIYSPSGAVRNKRNFARGVKNLTNLGYEVEIDKSALETHQRFAGTDEERLAAIHRAAESGADIALISRGGYGLTRLLPFINYSSIANAIDSGMKFVGLSDFTAFQMAVLTKTGSITWGGPTLDDFSNPAGVDDIMQDCFNDMALGQGEGSGWRLPKNNNSNDSLKNSLNNNLIEYNIENSILWGGNLSMLASLIGTPYFPKIEKGILFIEDIGEHPYRIERMLAQLLQAGILANQQAIIFGQFTNYKIAPHDKGYKLNSVIAWLQSQIKIPILTGLPFGHVSTKVLLPVGKNITLATEGRDALLLWGHF